MKQVDLIREHARKTPVFSSGSVVRMIGDSGYSYLLLNHLVRRGEIKRLTKGYYTIHDDPSLLVYCMKPAYLGLQDAMSLNNIWEQETGPVILTAKKIRPGTRKVLGSNVTVRRVSARYIFGFYYMKYGDLVMPVSDIEKTFIDMAYFRLLRKDTTRLFLKRLDRERVSDYLRKYDKRFSKRVLGLIT